MGEKHSAVGYLFREGAFLPAQETKPVHNEFGLDLFQHRGSVYEGKTGLQFCSLQQAEDLAGFVEKHGGIEKVQKLIADSLERTGLSPRYTRPDEKKKDIFPPKEKDENRVFAKDLMGNKHYYYRFYNENGIELYTMEKKREFFQTVYIPCDGFMVGIDQRHRLEEVLKWLPTLEHGIRGEIERVFNQSRILFRETAKLDHAAVDNRRFCKHRARNQAERNLHRKGNQFPKALRPVLHDLDRRGRRKDDGQESDNQRQDDCDHERIRKHLSHPCFKFLSDFNQHLDFPLFLLQ